MGMVRGSVGDVVNEVLIVLVGSFLWYSVLRYGENFGG